MKDVEGWEVSDMDWEKDVLGFGEVGKGDVWSGKWGMWAWNWIFFLSSRFGVY